MAVRDDTPDTPKALAGRLEAAVRERIGDARYQMWFLRRTALAATRAGVTVYVPTDSFRDWLEDKFGEEVRAAAVAVVGGKPAVRFEVAPERFADEEEPPKVEKTPPLPKPKKTLFGDELPPPLAPPKVRKTKSPPVIEPEPAPQAKSGRRWKTLGDFVVGACNRVAHAAALGVVEDFGDAPNPLVLYGPVGTGKTHLLEGIVVGLRARRGSDKPVYITAEEFTTRFVQASRYEKHEAFRRQFRDAAALLLDDLHFLATKPGTQREFLNTLDALVSDGRPVVLTMDCHPRLAEELMPELRDRLSGGAAWGLTTPDDATRLSVLRAKAATGTTPIPDAVLKALAKSLRGNVRELEGAIHSVRHFARVHARPVDLDLAREAVGDLLRHAVRAVTLADVDAAVVAALGLPVGSLQSKARNWAVTHPRMVAMFLCRRHTAATHGEIAKHFGVKTHSTAVAAEKRVSAWVAGGEEVAVGDRRWPIKDLLERVERELAK